MLQHGGEGDARALPRRRRQFGHDAWRSFLARTQAEIGVRIITRTVAATVNNRTELETCSLNRKLLNTVRDTIRTGQYDGGPKNACRPKGPVR